MGSILASKERNLKSLIRNGNRTEWDPIRSVIIRVITKSDDHAARVDRFVSHEYNYRPNWTTRSLIVNYIHFTSFRFVFFFLATEKAIISHGCRAGCLNSDSSILQK